MDRQLRRLLISPLGVVHHPNCRRFRSTPNYAAGAKATTSRRRCGRSGRGALSGLNSGPGRPARTGPGCASAWTSSPPELRTRILARSYVSSDSAETYRMVLLSLATMRSSAARSRSRSSRRSSRIRVPPISNIWAHKPPRTLERLSFHRYRWMLLGQLMSTGVPLPALLRCSK